jgi:hypothetical protein
MIRHIRVRCVKRRRQRGLGNEFMIEEWGSRKKENM